MSGQCKKCGHDGCVCDEKHPPGAAWKKFCDAELEIIRETGVIPDYIYFPPDEKTQEDLLNQRVRPKWEKGEGINDLEQCEKAVILANNIAKESTNREQFDTPETEEYILNNTALKTESEFVDFIRKLERERDEARREAEKYHGMVNDCKWPKPNLPWKTK